MQVTKSAIQLGMQWSSPIAAMDEPAHRRAVWNPVRSYTPCEAPFGAWGCRAPLSMSGIKSRPARHFLFSAMLKACLEVLLESWQFNRTSSGKPSCLPRKTILQKKRGHGLYQSQELCTECKLFSTLTCWQNASRQLHSPNLGVTGEVCSNHARLFCSG